MLGAVVVALTALQIEVLVGLAVVVKVVLETTVARGVLVITELQIQVLVVAVRAAGIHLHHIHLVQAALVL